MIITDKQKFRCWKMVKLGLKRTDIVKLLDIDTTDFAELYAAARKQYGNGPKKFIATRYVPEEIKKEFKRPPSVYSNPNYNI